MENRWFIRYKGQQVKLFFLHFCDWGAKYHNTNQIYFSDHTFKVKSTSELLYSPISSVFWCTFAQNCTLPSAWPLQLRAASLAPFCLLCMLCVYRDHVNTQVGGCVNAMWLFHSFKEFYQVGFIGQDSVFPPCGRSRVESAKQTEEFFAGGESQTVWEMFSCAKSDLC